jgi:glucose/arabinose dehydrogenase
MSLLVSLLLSLVSIKAYANKDIGYKSSGEVFRYEVLHKGKDVIWGFDFLDINQIIFSERKGSFKVLNLKSKEVSELSGAPTISSSGQGGLLDVRVHPVQNSKIYFSYSESTDKGLTTALGLATLEGGKLSGFKKLFSGFEPVKGNIHFGSRIEFDGKGHLWMSIGDRNERDKAQDLNFHNGKIIRLKEDGSVPTDNPFISNKNAKSEIWSFGHRNPQGLVFNSTTNELWSTEFGPKGGDELNLIEPGANYGWPVITYGREYYGPKIAEKTEKIGMKQPVSYWVPSISPSALTIYTGDKFPKWKGQFFIATLSGLHLRRLKLDSSQVTEQEELLNDQNIRIRNVRTGPDGFLYLSTDSGVIARLIHP